MRIRTLTHTHMLMHTHACSAHTHTSHPLSVPVVFPSLSIPLVYLVIKVPSGLVTDVCIAVLFLFTLAFVTAAFVKLADEGNTATFAFPMLTL